MMRYIVVFVLLTLSLLAQKWEFETSDIESLKKELSSKIDEDMINTPKYLKNLKQVEIERDKINEKHSKRFDEYKYKILP
jgi:hypothetical protein